MNLPESAAAPPSVRMDGVSYAYPDGHPALDDVHLDIARGERVAKYNRLLEIEGTSGRGLPYGLAY